MIKSTWSSVELNLSCVYLFWLYPDVSLTVKHYRVQNWSVYNPDRGLQTEGKMQTAGYKLFN